MKNVLFIIVLILMLSSCQESTVFEIIDRESKIPLDAVKITPETDNSPPKSYSTEYYDPIPLPYPINTAGAEDSAFILLDGNTIYFFFTPDVRVPVEKQVIDGVTGIYISKKINGEWERPTRVLLQQQGKLALDGCEFVQNTTMWFCTAREGFTGITWFTAEYINGKWQNWQSADFNSNYEIGELHIFNDELYFHSSKNGGKGGLDIWVSKKVNEVWQEPRNIDAINTADDEGWPSISQDGNELWFSKNYGIWRSKKVNDEWQTPEQMFSPLAGESSMDNAGNVYFTHHFFNNNTMIEADIYIAYKK